MPPMNAPRAKDNPAAWVAYPKASTTQSAVVLENLISQFLYSKAADGPSAKEAP